MIPYAQNVSLVRTKLAKLRPTQFSVGYVEVQLKAAEWARLKKKQRKFELQRHVFPAVLGLDGAYYIVDHHHLGIALLEQQVLEVWVAQLDDLSWLQPAAFWRTLEYRSWAHPYDQHGVRRDFQDIPRRLSQLRNDPYRGLAGLARLRGGFAKEPTPFAEFLWADFYRMRIGARLIEQRPAEATRVAIRLARSSDARYLPGWTGKTAVGRGKK